MFSFVGAIFRRKTFPLVFHKQHNICDHEKPAFVGLSGIRIPLDARQTRPFNLPLGFFDALAPNTRAN
jgi:hypothetical protein